MSGSAGPGRAGARTFSVKADNRFEEIDRVNAEFEAFAADHGLPEAVRRSLKLVFDEVLHNVVAYAYDDGGRHTIDVSVVLSDDEVLVRIADDGRAFDPLAHPTPDTDAGIDEREVGGLGIHLVRKLMDRVSYSREGGRNVVSVAKRLEGPDEGERGDR